MVNEFYFFTEWEGNSLPLPRLGAMVHHRTPPVDRKYRVCSNLKIA